MRFDTLVYFVHVNPGAYNSDTGNYEPDKLEEVKRYADVTDAGTETLRLIYGELRQGIKVIRLQNHYAGPFDRIRIDRKLYRVDFSRKLKNKQVFVVSEVQ